ncbi:LytR/AlgR family response regulator transcription factor [Chryseobacterium populi]|uniref:Response regulator of the LytR/AlgR family n=1 Tax=Chryseobacterium populi TaxID=1144316 RepID=J2KCE5_9FLAO|nr:LytTR family DNA-binding domain-containing protein [Chryseobacterium populi]EJL70838.1 response regulator of the LytR/AlgR family [Chryseobacterium populi]
MKTKCVIVDDEPLATDVLVNYFKNYPNYEIVSVFFDSVQALEFLKKNPIDILFVDINMPQMSGFELIRLYENSNNTKIIVTTAYREFAAESYDLNVLDYLVKPIPLFRFIKSVSKIENELKRKVTDARSGHIIIKVEKKMVKLCFDEILFVEGMKEYIKVIAQDKIYITYRTLSSISEELPEQLFSRVHKSFTVSLDKINSIEGNMLHIAGYRIPIGRKFNKEVKTKILK